MLNLREYRKNTHKLADLLTWVALVAPGVILNKDGSLQRTLYYRGPDVESFTETQLASIHTKINNACKRLGSGWAIYIEARREPYQIYPDSQMNHLVSHLIEAERRAQFKETHAYFESHTYLTLQFISPQPFSTRWSRLFLSHSNLSLNVPQKELEFFIETTQRLKDLLTDIFYEIRFLDDRETLTYLHKTISTKHHPIQPPEIPVYLDTFLADEPLLGGLEPKLGKQFLRMVSIIGFPAHSMPVLLNTLNQLPMAYRWSTRFIPLDRKEAESLLKRYQQRWFSKRKNMLHLFQEIFTKNESRLLNTTSIEYAQDANAALNALENDRVSYGYYTTTITVMDEDYQRVLEMQHEIERVINGLGFTTRSETFNAVEAWLSSIPGHAYANVRMPILHSLNWAHLIPIAATWPGPDKDTHLNAPPLMYVHSHGRTPFRWTQYVGDVGHQMIIGPTGAGKSVLLMMIALQFQRYKEAQVFIFDKGGSALAATMGMNGGYYELSQKTTHLVFQPLANISDESEKIWAYDWVCQLLLHEGVEISPTLKRTIWNALSSLSRFPMVQRTLSGLIALLQDNSLKNALFQYTVQGPYGYLLDSDHENLRLEKWQCYEMEALMNTPAIIPPILSYLFHRLEHFFDGAPTLLILDEAWLFLKDRFFTEKIRDWLKSLRKKNVSVIFATQSVNDALESTITEVLLESCASRILLPHDRILEPAIREKYERLGLNEAQIHVLANATPKLQYYYQSRMGNRLFSLELGPIALSFCAASRPEDLQYIKQLYQVTQDPLERIKTYLTARQLDWIWSEIT